MSGDDKNPCEHGAGSPFVIRISEMGNGVLAMKPRILGLRSGDVVRWELRGKKFSIKFKASDPSKPRPHEREVKEPDYIHSDSDGIARVTAHAKAFAEYPYQVILNEDPKSAEGHGALLVNTTMAVIIRGPVDPV